MSGPGATVSGMTHVGVIFPPDQPPERLREVAQAAEAAGLDELWLWEDCFKEAGISAAAAALAWTTRLKVGVALLPVPLRNVTLTAMEIATLARLFPGRFLPAVGHGVLDWMGQAGARVESPMTLLREYVEALQALLASETVTASGRYVRLDAVALDWPPEQVPPVLVGAYRPKTLALAGELGDGVVVDRAEALPDAVAQVRAAREAAGRDGEPEVLVFQTVSVGTPAETVAEQIRERAAEGAHRVALAVVPTEGAPPEAGPALVDVLPVLGRAAEQVRDGRQL
ncbi:N5,N10-methylenetetrahydromethanopterin reductase-related protein [Serinicoccus hydrothermalis]|uniref:N5,N10-methylenetetrahydromethanopterin reductase-related protein n=2 Tax=Serinicoccus hydrothermalis TaxID=1758689 RepID=A0A1B1NBW3_9MICO|nr:N5,N10-methylenetetrahydromethanopterin reductase-related protein [Serinicoccus hydrothermalis]